MEGNKTPTPKSPWREDSKNSKTDTIIPSTSSDKIWNTDVLGDGYCLRRMMLFSERKLLESASTHTMSMSISMSTSTSSPSLSQDTANACRDNYDDDGFANDFGDPVPLFEDNSSPTIGDMDNKGRTDHSPVGTKLEGLEALEERVTRIIAADKKASLLQARQSHSIDQSLSLLSTTSKSPTRTLPNDSNKLDTLCNHVRRKRRDPSFAMNHVSNLKPSELTIRTLSAGTHRSNDTRTNNSDFLKPFSHQGKHAKDIRSEYVSSTIKASSILNDYTASPLMNSVHQLSNCKNGANTISNAKRIDTDERRPVVFFDSPSEQNYMPQNHSERVGDLYDKYESILDCLRGDLSVDDESTVDDSVFMINLWRLREMAFTKGGYLCPSIRKRVWPILTGCHVDVMSLPIRKLQEIVSTSSTEDTLLPCLHPTVSKAMIADIRRKYKKPSDKLALSNFSISKKRPVDYQSNVLDDVSTSSDDVSTLSPSTSSSSVASLLSEENYSTDIKSRDFFCVADRYQQFQVEKIEDNIEQIRSNLIATQLIKTEQDYSNKNRDLQRTMANVLSMVLRRDTHERGTIESSNSIIGQGNTSSLRYYDGLVHLADLLLSNVESPSLTTLILNKLASHQLSDCFRGNQMTATLTGFETCVMLTFLPLLRSVEYGLYHDLISYLSNFGDKDDGNGSDAQLASAIQTLSVVVAKYASTWFCVSFTSNSNDVSSSEEAIEAAARLADVCLVSHPLFPIYIAVSILSLHKQRLRVFLSEQSKRMNTGKDINELTSQLDDLFRLNNVPYQAETLSSDPGTETATQSPLLQVVEDVIANCVRYLKIESIKSLTTKASLRSKTSMKNKKWVLSDFSSLSDSVAPFWSVTNTTPTECALIERRGSASVGRNDKSDCGFPFDGESLYPNSLAACGMLPHKHCNSQQVSSWSDNQNLMIPILKSKRSLVSKLRLFRKSVRFTDEKSISLSKVWIFVLAVATLLFFATGVTTRILARNVAVTTTEKLQESSTSTKLNYFERSIAGHTYVKDQRWNMVVFTIESDNNIIHKAPIREMPLLNNDVDSKEILIPKASFLETNTRSTVQSTGLYMAEPDSRKTVQSLEKLMSRFVRSSRGVLQFLKQQMNPSPQYNTEKNLNLNLLVMNETFGMETHFDIFVQPKFYAHTNEVAGVKNAMMALAKDYLDGTSVKHFVLPIQPNEILVESSLKRRKQRLIKTTIKRVSMWSRNLAQYGLSLFQLIAANQYSAVATSYNIILNIFPTKDLEFCGKDQNLYNTYNSNFRSRKKCKQ